MNRGARFWASMAVFQVLFGLTVFAATRQYYLHDRDQADDLSPVAGVAAPVRPGSAGQSGLTDFVPVFPGDAMIGDPVAMAQRADELFDQQQYDEAADLYEKLLLAGFQDVNTYNSLGITLQYLGRSAEALSVLQEGVEVDSTFQRIWLTLGFVNSQIGHTEQAREALSTAVRLGPDTEVGKSAADMLERLEGPE